MTTGKRLTSKPEPVDQPPAIEPAPAKPAPDGERRRKLGVRFG